MKSRNVKICDSTIYPGEIATLALPFPDQYSCAPLYMPIKVIHGEKKGPCLVIFSVLRGNELNGLEITNRTIKSLMASEVSGVIIAIPVLNVYGLTHYPSVLPSGTDLVNCFPGKENGSYGERLAYLITHEILKKADYCIELQTGGPNHNILPQVYCDFDDKHAKELAKMFRTPIVTNIPQKRNSLRKTAEELQVPLLVYQAGEAMRFDENAITLGVHGINNIMCAVDMLAKEPSQEITPTFSKEEDWIVAHKSGILHTSVSLGQTIEKDEVIGIISDPFGADIHEPVRSPQKGIVVGVNTSPLIHEGLAIFKLAFFLDYEKAGNIIEEWEKENTGQNNER